MWRRLFFISLLCLTTAVKSSNLFYLASDSAFGRFSRRHHHRPFSPLPFLWLTTNPLLRTGWLGRAGPPVVTNRFGGGRRKPATINLNQKKIHRQRGLQSRNRCSGFRPQPTATFLWSGRVMSARCGRVSPMERIRTRQNPIKHTVGLWRIWHLIG